MKLHWFLAILLYFIKLWAKSFFLIPNSSPLFIFSVAINFSWAFVVYFFCSLLSLSYCCCLCCCCCRLPPPPIYSPFRTTFLRVALSFYICTSNVRESKYKHQFVLIWFFFWRNAISLSQCNERHIFCGGSDGGGGGRIKMCYKQLGIYLRVTAQRQYTDHDDEDQGWWRRRPVWCMKCIVFFFRNWNECREKLILCVVWMIFFLLQGIMNTTVKSLTFLRKFLSYLFCFFCFSFTHAKDRLDFSAMIRAMTRKTMRALAQCWWRWWASMVRDLAHSSS